MAISPLEGSLDGLPEKLLVGISGGLDSMALLHALVQDGRKPTVLHFDHGWRKESASDAAWVKEQARQAGLKFFGGRARAVKNNQRETEARVARYAFFMRASRRFNITDLVLAHHADDQVETFLLQLLRGAGAGARGMDPVSPRGGLKVHRPWLGIWRKEIAAYARRRRLTWRDDSTNADPRHRRNLIRHRVLPYLKRQFSPAVTQNLWRAAEIARAESLWLDTLCAVSAAKPELAVKALRARPLAGQRRTILRWLQARGVPDLSFADVEAVRGLLEQALPAKINLGGGKFARRRAGILFVD